MTAGWKTLPLGELCEFQRGLTYAKGDEVDTSDNVVLRATNIDLTTNLLDFSELKYINDEIQIPESKKVKKGSLMICTASGSKSHLGKVAFIDDDYGFAFGGFMGMVTPKNGLDPKYLFHLMTSDAYKAFIAELSDGANINNLKFDDLGRFPVPHPDSQEQKRIVRILDEVLASIATAKANAEKNCENADALSKSFVHSVLAQPSRAWNTKTLDELATNLDGKRVPITKNERKAGKYPYYGASGIVDHVADYLFEGETLLVSEDGANLLMRSTPIAFPASGRYWVNNHAHVLNFESPVTQRFVEHYLEAIDLSQYITGAAQPKLTQKALNSIPIPIPLSIEEQRRVVTAIDEMAAETRKLRELQRRKIDSLKALRDTVLSEAFSGRL